ncbi:unnamed protein product, partial [Nesidiocoris tenuis]
MSAINLADMPEVVLEHIFSFLTYDNIAQNRIVSRKFNTLGAKMLNKGYYMADRYHEKTLKAIKAKLPRRESERRVHPLARQCDILIAIETRLSMLAMTFSKWIDANVCCFIPGKVIDEIMRVLRCVANNPCPPRAHEILQELRDISSMAMEHFDERILPILKSNIRVPPYFNLAEPLTCATAPSRTASLGFVRYKPRSACLQQAERHTSVSTLELSEQKTIAEDRHGWCHSAGRKLIQTTCSCSQYSTQYIPSLWRGLERVWSLRRHYKHCKNVNLRLRQAPTLTLLEQALSRCHFIMHAGMYYSLPYVCKVCRITAVTNRSLFVTGLSRYGHDLPSVAEIIVLASRWKWHFPGHSMLTSRATQFLKSKKVSNDTLKNEGTGEMLK